MNLMDKIDEMYRASASLILAAKQPEIGFKDDEDYELLIIKRTARTSYATNHCVFPGGVFDEAADECSAWLIYMRTFGITEQQIQMLSPQVGSKKRPMLLTSGNEFSRDISLRLTAIRETFEEVGLLLCRGAESLQSLLKGLPIHVYESENFDRKHWQNLVHNNAQQFLVMCQQLQVIPDLWALSEWSVWHSPATAHRKYDTVYYFAALEIPAPPLVLESSEVQTAYWQSPKTALNCYAKEEIWLPFMLFYDISRIRQIRRLDLLANFARTRSQLGTTQMTLTYFRCDDCVIGVLPGDDLYPAYPDAHVDTISFRGIYNEVRSFSKNFHRLIIKGMHDAVIECNVAPLDGHLHASSISWTPSLSKL